MPKVTIAMLSFFAQTPVPPSLDGSPMGWASIFIQGGAFLLVCYIVVFMYPKVTKESRDEREKRDKAFTDAIALMQDKFEARNLAVVTAIKEQTVSIVRAVNEHK